MEEAVEVFELTLSTVNINITVISLRRIRKVNSDFTIAVHSLVYLAYLPNYAQLLSPSQKTFVQIRLGFGK